MSACNRNSDCERSKLTFSFLRYVFKNNEHCIKILEKSSGKIYFPSSMHAYLAIVQPFMFNALIYIHNVHVHVHYVYKH